MSKKTVINALVQFKNALKVIKKEVEMPYSKMIFSIFEIFKREGLIEKIEIIKTGGRRKIKVVSKEPFLREIKIISRPGWPIYLPFKKIREEKGFLIISTPFGLLSLDEAKAKRTGGEPICKIYF